MSASRWIRLDTTWDHSEWVAALEPEAQLAWVKLLCHVKAHGYAGSVKRLPHSVAARVWGLRVTSVTEMETAALRDQALVIEEDEWVITSWSMRQSDPKAAERMRRYRERQQELTAESEKSDVTRNSRNVTGATPTETETETTTETTDTSKPIPVSDMWEAWVEVLGGEGRRPKLTAKRRQALKLLYLEHLKNDEDPIATFRRVLKAVLDSEHHMGTRAYQMPESLFRNEERRDRWVTVALNGNGNSKGKRATQTVRYY